jgi:hypothetical protein
MKIYRTTIILSSTGRIQSLAIPIMQSKSSVLAGITMYVELTYPRCCRMVQGDGTIWKNRVHPLDFLSSSVPGEEQNIVARFIFHYTSLGMPYRFFI